jgi:hypothetical protein
LASQGEEQRLAHAKAAVDFSSGGFDFLDAINAL